MRDERGQALVVAVLAIGIAATAIVALRASQDRVLAEAKAVRAGEAAAESAAQSLADSYVASISRRNVPSEIVASALVGDQTVHARAAQAADELARENEIDGVTAVEVHCRSGRLEASLLLRGRTHRAGFAVPACRQP